MSTLIGSELRTARELRNLSLADVAHETRIPVPRIQWLEQDNYAAFGSLTYARAFLKIYSRYLQVDADEILGELPNSRLKGACDYRHLMANFGPWIPSKPSAATPKAPVSTGHRSPVFTGLFLFVLMLASTGYWGHQLSVSRSTEGLRSDATPVAEQIRPTSKTTATKRKGSPTTGSPLTQVSTGFDAGIAPTLR
ncbi:Helix-turn-helix domain-containing protein [Prosthecobacter debontii]|uniref:Helix-turn-helix domain-containing protein n=1 Tax=Prosthecobacter debontii TaxID=48467 RepID=A0A1T4YUG6_9BACT|nr:helix-turn-helix domain-containing protein [Prosthecobacter debontii]SKB05313.1 Helix-turn-helix domain-containing protein [Prosthecobacter debontii]